MSGAGVVLYWYGGSLTLWWTSYTAAVSSLVMVPVAAVHGSVVSVITAAVTSVRASVECSAGGKVLCDDGLVSSIGSPSGSVSLLGSLSRTAVAGGVAVTSAGC